MEPSTVIKPGMDVWTEYGFTGLFAFVFLIFFFYMLYELRRNNKEAVAMTVKTTACIESDNELKRELIGVTRELQKTIEQNTQQSRDFLTYMRARDQFFGGPKP